MLIVQIIISFLFSVFSISKKVFFTNSVKLCSFKFEHFTKHFPSDFMFYKTVYQFSKALKFFMYFYGFLLRKILGILQFFQYAKIYETMDNVDIALFYRILC